MARSSPPSTLPKVSTGIVGLDALTRGGLPAGRVSLISGGAGSGKTIVGLQVAVHGARHDEPAVFVAFEEHPEQILRNAASFGWRLEALPKGALTFLDAVLSPETIQAGDFDLRGLLATLGAQVKAMGAKRVVLDALDVPFGLLADPWVQRREIHRLHQWLLEQDLTAVLTAKALLMADGAAAPLGFLPYLTDCSIELRHDIVSGVSQRSIRVAKYRGSSFSENASPFVISDRGVEVAGPITSAGVTGTASTERISSGVARLDKMLEGGHFRGSSILVTGAPGTAKTTLAGAMLAAACARGEPGLFVSFDSEPAEIIRNLASVGIDLAPHVRSGRLTMASYRSGDHRGEVHLLQIRALMREHGTRVLVVDPVSALGKLGNEDTAHGVVERLIDGAKADGVTVFCSSLLGQEAFDREGTPIQISTIADTWIHLTYQAAGGERNRALTIIKARGTAHSNQVRELVLSSKGVTLADVYMAQGEVLMGTMRAQREAAERAAAAAQREATERRRREIELDTERLAAQVQDLQREIAVQEETLRDLERTTHSVEGAERAELEARGRQRRADDAPPSAPPPPPKQPRAPRRRNGKS